MVRGVGKSHSRTRFTKDRCLGNRDTKPQVGGSFQFLKQSPGHWYHVEAMNLNLRKKRDLVAQVAEIAGRAQAMIAAEYRGLTAEEMVKLRVKARNSGVYLRVVKNTLARRALEGTDFDCVRDGLIGPLVLAFSQQEPGAAARVIEDFTKEHKVFVVKLIAMGGKRLDPSEIGRLARLPTWEQAISILLVVLKAPLVRLVRTFKEPHAKLVRTLAAVRDQKGGG
jgi:Ribosomal protein L10